MKKISASILSAIMMLSMIFSSSVFAANDQTQTSAWDSFVGLFTKATTAGTMGVEYAGWVQDVGQTPTDGTYITGPGQLGTPGLSRRLEGVQIKLTGAIPTGASIKYIVHVQDYGWMGNIDDTTTWKANGTYAGTKDESKRIEDIKIVLVGADGKTLPGYSVSYMGHVQNEGDTAWVSDGASFNNTGKSQRLECLEVKITQTKADMTAYNAALAAVKQADYTTTSWTAYQAVVTANVVTADNTQAQVDTATAAITAAQKNLVKAADLTAYNAALAKANAAVESDYTADSWAALQAAITANVVTKDDTQTKVDAAAKAINDAYDALVPVTTLTVKAINAVDAAGVKTSLNGSTVARNSSFELTFNGAFDPATVTSTTIKLAKGTETMAISTPSINNGVVTFNSLTTLAAGTQYTLTLDGVKSADGTVTIANTKIATFTAADTVVAKKVVANNTKIYDSTTTDGVSLNVTSNWTYGLNPSTIVATFDTPVDKSTINSSTIKLIDVDTGKSLSVEGNQYLTNEVTINVVGSGDYLVPKHQYKLVLNGLKAANGKAIDTFAVTFAYKAGAPIAVDVAPIYNGDLNPIANTLLGLVNPSTTGRLLDDGTNYKAAAAVTVDFGAASVKLDESTVTTDYLYIRDKDTKVKVAQTISYNKEMNRVTLTPTESLSGDKTYEIYQSPYMKNVFGITVGSKDSDYKTTTFKTLDVTAPTVTGTPVSTLTSQALTNLPVDSNFKIRIPMSEKIGTVVYNPTTTAVQFATASATGNVLVTRADDDTILANTALAGLITNVQKIVVGTTQYIELSVNPQDVAAVKGKTFRVTLAGTNPTRANNANYVITDAYSVSPNALANDYSFTFSFVGEDKTAPAVSGVTGSYDGAKLESTSIQGMTNVNQGLMRINFNCKDVNAATIPNITLVDKNNAAHIATLVGSIVVTGETSYANVSFSGAADGPATLKVQDVADTNGNVSSLQSYDLTVGNGPMITGALFATTSNDTATPTVAGDSIVRINYSGDIDTTTLDGNVKLLNGTTEVAATVDASKAGYLRVLPTAPLTAGTQYTVMVSKNVKDTNGNMLQQTTTAAPVDFSIKLTTVSSSAANLVTSVVNETARTITLTFDKNIGTVDSNVTLVNYGGSNVTITNDSASATPQFIAIDGKTVTLTVFQALASKVDYQGSIAVHDKDGIASSANFDALTTKAWRADANLAKPLVSGVTTPNASGTFTLTFTEPVKVNDVKAALKAYNATDAANVTMFASSIVPGTIQTVSGVDYSDTYTVSVPGFNTAKTYVMSLAAASFTDEAGFTNTNAWDATLGRVATGVAISGVDRTQGRASVTAVYGELTGKNVVTPANLSAVTDGNVAVTVGLTVFNLDHTAIAGMATPVDRAAVANALKNATDGTNALSTVADVTIDVNNKLNIKAKAAATGTDVAVAITGADATTIDGVFGISTTPVTVAGRTLVTPITESNIVGFSSATATGTIVVTIDGADYNVAVSGGDSAVAVAGKVRAAIPGAATANWNVTNNDNGTLTFTSVTTGADVTDLAISVN